MREVLRMSQSVSHHVNTGPSSRNTSKVNEECSKEKAELQLGGVMHVEFDFVNEENTPNEERLDREHEECLPKQVKLVGGRHVVLLLVLLDKSVVSHRVDRSSNFQVFRLHNRQVVFVQQR